MRGKAIYFDVETPFTGQKGKHGPVNEKKGLCLHRLGRGLVGALNLGEMRGGLQSGGWYLGFFSVDHKRRRKEGVTM